MSCARCADLRQDVAIRGPSELEKAIRIVGANLDDGTLIERVEAAKLTFSNLRQADVWPDVIDCGFQCSQCGETFRLRCDTYHGGGGWTFGASVHS